jgi:hypothetical protein
MPAIPPKRPRLEFIRDLLPADLSEAEFEAEEKRFWTYLRLYHRAAKRAIERERDSTLRQSDSMMGDTK